MQLLIKTLISALLIAAASGLARRSSWIGAIVVSLPLTSILAMSWLYWDSRDLGKVAAFSSDVFWAVIPSLIFFVAFPALARAGAGFVAAMTGAAALTVAGYAALAWVQRSG